MRKYRKQKFLESQDRRAAGGKRDFRESREQRRPNHLRNIRINPKNRIRKAKVEF